MMYEGIALCYSTMNQFMSNLVCEGFHHVLEKYDHENAEMQKMKIYVLYTAQCTSECTRVVRPIHVLCCEIQVNFFVCWV